MQVTVERRPGSQVELTVTVEPSRVEERVEALFQRHARRVNVPGFRPGKAPRHLVEQRISKTSLLPDAIEDLIDTTYKDALREENLEPLERGEIEDIHTAEDLTLTYKVVVSVRPEITLPPYTDVKVRYQSTQVTEEQVDAEIERLRDRTADFGEILDEGIQTGDYVTVDYTMTVDGEAYPEGDTTGYPLEVGSDTFFPELNERLPGVKQGETVTLTTSYPPDYTNPDLAGKTAEFEITVQQVRRVVRPEVSDSWVELISQGSLKTVAELRERLLHNLQVMAAEADHDHIRASVVAQVVNGATLEVPATLEEEQFEHQMQGLEQRVAREHMSLEEYANASNTSMANIEQEQRVLARDMVRRSLVLQEIARRERIAISDEDINEALAAMAQGGRPVKELRREMDKTGQLDHLASRIFHEKVLAFLESHADVQAEGEAAAGAEAPAEPEKSAE